MNLGILVVGLVGAVVVGAGLSLQQRRAATRLAALRSDGRRAHATIRSIVSTGRQSTHRQVTLVTADGSEFRQTFSFVEADRLELEVGGGATVLQEIGNPTNAMIETLASGTRPAEPATGHLTPALVGGFIALLAVAAAAVT